jgi:hypothetical protein
MKTFHKINISICVLFFAFLLTSCLQKQESIGNAGHTFVKLNPTVYNMLAFDAKAVPQTGLLFEVRRDVPNSIDLKTTTQVVVKYDADTAILKKYNAANETEFIPLPPELGTVSPAITAGTITVDFAANDIGKAIIINVPNAANFDFSMHYALAFTIQSVSGTGSLSAADNDTIVCEVLAKNKWDGIYTADGTFTDYINGAAWAGIYPKVVQLQTVGANRCTKYDADYATYGYVFEVVGSGASSFGAFTPAFIFDADNNVDVVNTSVDSPARGRSAVLYTGDGAINKYFDADKSMDVAYYLKQLNVSPQLRTLMMEHYTFKGPR